MTKQCSQCGQLSTTEQPDGYVCSGCVHASYPKLNEDLYKLRDSERLALEFKVDDSLCAIPLNDNLLYHTSYYATFEEWESAIHTLIDFTKTICFDSFEVSNHKLKFVELEDYSTTQCDETELYLFNTLAYRPGGWYTRPTDTEPTDMVFLCIATADAKAGHHYSKDYQWSTCETCHRTICEQDPSNGYVSHGSHDEETGEWECYSCRLERMWKYGSDLDGDKVNALKFEPREDAEDNGWVFKEYITVGNGVFGRGMTPKKLHEYLKTTYKDLTVLIIIDELSQFGDGGEFSIYTKKQ